MSDESPFGDFSSEQPAQTFDEDQPIALPPPTDNTDDAFGDVQEDRDAPVDDDGFGLASPPAAAVSSEQHADDDGEASDPFATVDGGSTENAGAFDSFTNQQPEVKEEEAAALKAWEAERSQVLRERASKAAADKQSALKSAREETEKFYADRDSQVTKSQKTNRADEKNYRADMKTTFESGARWEKVNKLISTQPKQNEKAGTSRVDRMRKLLLQLKTEKPKA